MLKVIFNRAMLCSLLLHLMVIGVWSYSQNDDVIHVPFKPREMTIKIGIVNGISQVYEHKQVDKYVKKPVISRMKPVQKPSTNKTARRITRKKQLSKTKPLLAKKRASSARKTSAKKAILLPIKGVSLGNREHARRQTIDSYKQLLMAWIERHKAYPKGARKDQLSGYAIIRMQILKNGVVRFRTLEQKTGHHVLDMAILNMIDRANPLPPFPKNYPNVEVDEFIIPVHISFESG